MVSFVGGKVSRKDVLKDLKKDVKKLMELVDEYYRVREEVFDRVKELIMIADEIRTLYQSIEARVTGPVKTLAEDVVREAQFWTRILQRRFGEVLEEVEGK